MRIRDRESCMRKKNRTFGCEVHINSRWDTYFSRRTDSMNFGGHILWWNWSGKHRPNQEHNGNRVLLTKSHCLPHALHPPTDTFPAASTDIEQEDAGPTTCPTIIAYFSPIIPHVRWQHLRCGYRPIYKSKNYARLRWERDDLKKKNIS